MSQICNHNWIQSNIHGYNQCTICGTYNLINNPGTAVYTDNYWSPVNNRSTLDEQVGNFTANHNGRSKLEVLMSHVSVGGYALEIACAPGIVLNRLAELHDTAFGIEADPSNFGEIARIAARDNVRIWQGFFPTDFFGLDKNLFDHIVASDVLEHVENPEHFISRAADILTPSGKLVVMTPILQPGVDMPSHMWNIHEHIWMFSIELIVQLFTKYFREVKTENWIPGHEVIVGAKKR